MSNRVEELANNIAKILDPDNDWEKWLNPCNPKPIIAALIDAELRKERERAAAIAIGTINTAILFASVKGETIDWPCTPDELRAAILAEEED